MPALDITAGQFGVAVSAYAFSAGISGILAAGFADRFDRKRLIIAGFLTEACVSFSALSALADGFDVFVGGDACGGLTPASHELALRRLEQAGARLTSWQQALLELQRDWTRHATYEAAHAIVVANGGGHGMGLVYSREMIHPAERRSLVGQHGEYPDVPPRP